MNTHPIPASIAHLDFPMTRATAALFSIHDRRRPACYCGREIFAHEPNCTGGPR